MTALLTRVRTRARLATNAQAWQLLQGAYASVHHERSLDVTDLREYVVGDNPRDIDWRATARSQSTLVRRTIASRRHQVWLVVDTGRSMAAHNTRGVAKRELLITAAGVLGAIATDQGDVVGLVAADREDGRVIPPSSGDAHLERLLRHIHGAARLDAAPTSPTRTWSTAARAARRRGILVLLSDDHDLGDHHEHLLRRLRAHHTVMHISVDDADLSAPDLIGAAVADIADGRRLPDFLARDTQLLAQLRDVDERRHQIRTQMFDRLGICHTTLPAPDAVVPTLLRLLHRSSRVR